MRGTLTSVCKLENNFLKDSEGVEGNSYDDSDWYHPNYERNTFKLFDDDDDDDDDDH